MGGMIFGGLLILLGIPMLMGGAAGPGATCIVVGAFAALVGFSNWNAWRNRAMRLCTNCFTQAQPLRHSNKRWYCGFCGADNPAPLDSPLAQNFLRQQQADAAARAQAVSTPQLPR